MATKRNYKDSMFRAIFKNKRELMVLYNALTGDNLTDPRAITINTLKGVLYNDLRNDLSFQVGDRTIVLLEEQSTDNGNMPLRMLMYITQIYRKIVPQEALYQQKTYKIPAPQFYVLYNGEKDLPVKKDMKLSEAFDFPTGDLDLTVHLYNITEGKDSPLFPLCPVLKEYSYFVYKVQSLIASGLDRDHAIRAAIRYFLEHDMLQDFFREHNEEVYDMLSLRWDPEIAKKVAIREAREEALEEGHAKGLAEGHESGVKEGGFNEKVASAIRMLKANIALDIIALSTALSIPKIRAIASENGIPLAN